MPTLPQGAANPCEKQAGWGVPLAQCFREKQPSWRRTTQREGQALGTSGQTSLCLTPEQSDAPEPLSCLSTSRGACGGWYFGPRVRGGREGRTRHPPLATQVDP